MRKLETKFFKLDKSKSDSILRVYCHKECPINEVCYSVTNDSANLLKPVCKHFTPNPHESDGTYPGCSLMPNEE